MFVQPNTGDNRYRTVLLTQQFDQHPTQLAFSVKKVIRPLQRKIYLKVLAITSASIVPMAKLRPDKPSTGRESASPER